jgi:predicted GNAT family acetyltransferase
MTAKSDSAPTIVDNSTDGRFELRLDGELVGFADYRPAGDSVIIAHTEIVDGHEGKGFGGLLVREALERIRASGKTVIPACSFTASYIGRHPEFAELVAPSLRDQFTD